MAVFQGGAVESQLLAITEIDPATWASLKPALANAALVRLEEIPGVSVPYVHFHPTLAPFLARDLPADQRAALKRATGRRTTSSPTASTTPTARRPTRPAPWPARAAQPEGRPAPGPGRRRAGRGGGLRRQQTLPGRLRALAGAG
ncbi:MAG: hypothetical protein M9927_15485 [Anaerolineae bacterium]|nr:hypothetical protein [Anaerolineae bacterium]